MKILSHRGFWLKNSEKNKQEAFKRSFDANFGLETDIRDCFFKRDDADIGGGGAACHITRSSRHRMPKI